MTDVVVGSGVTGAATAAAVAGRGQGVVLIEKRSLERAPGRYARPLSEIATAALDVAALRAALGLSCGLRSVHENHWGQAGADSSGSLLDLQSLAREMEVARRPLGAGS